MKRLLRTALVWACCVSPFGLASAAEDAKPAEGARKPIKALLVTGGCCHDYERQKVILSRGISARADVVWTIVHQGGNTTDTMIPLS